MDKLFTHIRQNIDENINKGNSMHIQNITPFMSG